MKKSIFALATVCLVAGVFVAAQQGRAARRIRVRWAAAIAGTTRTTAPTPPTRCPRPSTVWIEEMTWMDVRDALKAGKTTAIVATGGIEPNGPWLVTGKHNYVLHANCDAIARKLGNALCAPIVKFVPEGDIDPPTGHMTARARSRMREETFQAVLTDVAESLQGARLQEHRLHRRQRRQPEGPAGRGRQAQRPSGPARPSALHIPEYYTYNVVTKHFEDQGALPKDRKSDACTTIRSSRSTCSSTTRSRCATTSA